MASKKPQIEKLVDELLQLPENTPELTNAIRRCAEDFIHTPKQKLTQEILKHYKSILELTEKKKLVLSNEELDNIDLEIKRMTLQKSILETALNLRHERFYAKPSYPLERNIADAAIFSISPRKKPTKDGDKAAGFVRNNGKAIISHAGNKELTMQDAKVLIAINKVWEEEGRKKLFEVPIYQIAKKLNRAKSGKTYDEIWTSLETIFDTKVQFLNFNENGSLKELEQVHILERVGTRGEKAKIMFSETIYNSLLSGALIYVSLALLDDLSSQTAQGLYVYFSSQISQGIVEWELEDLCKILDIKSNSTNRKKMIRTACEDLMEIGLLTDFSIYKGENKTEFLRIVPADLLLGSNNKLSGTSQQLTLPGVL